MFYSPAYSTFFPAFAAVSPGPWRQIVICSFASLTPHHMAPNNWKWKRWRWMLRQNPPSSRSVCNSDTFQKVDVGIVQITGQTSFFHFNQTSIRIEFAAQIISSRKAKRALWEKNAATPTVPALAKGWNVKAVRWSVLAAHSGCCSVIRLCATYICCSFDLGVLVFGRASQTSLNDH